MFVEEKIIAFHDEFPVKVWRLAIYQNECERIIRSKRVFRAERENIFFRLLYIFLLSSDFDKI